LRGEREPARPILAPHAHEIGGAPGEEIGFGGLALALEQAAACRLQVEQQLALGCVAQIAAHPTGGGQPLPACDGHEPMQRRGGIRDSATRPQLEGFLAGRCVYDQFTTIVGGRH
jgi:hypothetical protein